MTAAGADGIWAAPKYDGLADRHQRIAMMSSTPGPMPRGGAWRNPGIPRLQAVGRMSNRVSPWGCPGDVNVVTWGVGSESLFMSGVFTGGCPEASSI